MQHTARWVGLTLLALVGVACASGGGGRHLGDPADRQDTRAPGADVAGGADTGGSPADTGTPTTSNHPPVLHKIGDKVAPVGETLAITLTAEDQDEEALVFSVFGEIPPGAKFDKGEHVFTWSPKQDRIDQCVYITFVVSDSRDFDRETVQICVSAMATPHAPSFVEVASQYPQVGKPFQLQLEATDPDGDALAYDIDGPRPEGATVDGTTGLFSWTPREADVGPPVRVRFRASDGTLVATLEVLFFVQGEGQTARPPEFEDVAAQQARVGALLAFEVRASDPDTATLTYSMRPGAPPGSTFDAATRRFSWTPTVTDAGRAYEATFEVSDGPHNDLLRVTITVVSGDTPVGDCAKDGREPNDSSEQATLLAVGTMDALSICDKAAPADPGRDIDWFAISLVAGQTLTVDIAFEHAKGDLDAQLFEVERTEPVVVAESSDDDERVQYVASGNVDLLLAVYGYTGGRAVGIANTYALTVTVTSGACTDDGREQNDDEGTATELTLAELEESLTGLRICPGDVDWYRFDLACGQRLELLVGFRQADGDLDATLFGPTGNDAIAEGLSADDDELLILESVPESGSYYLVIHGYPPEATQNSYELLGDFGSPTACTPDDFEPNDRAQDARPFPETGTAEGLTLCCEPDWFTLPVQAGDAVLATARNIDGQLTMRLVGPDRTSLVAASTDDSGDQRIEIPSMSEGGTHYLVIETTAYPAAYDLSVLLMGAGTGSGCTPTSCELYSVCDAASGQCVSDWCPEAANCPSGYACRDTFCVNPCESDSDCRPSYRCKTFEDGSYCGPVASGAAGAGAPCTGFDGCTGAAICWSGAGAPFCAQLGCTASSDCGTGKACVDVDGTAACLAYCASEGDCLTEGHGCRTQPTLGGGSATVCAP